MTRTVGGVCALVLLVGSACGTATPSSSPPPSTQSVPSGTAQATQSHVPGARTPESTLPIATPTTVATPSPTQPARPRPSPTLSQSSIGDDLNLDVQTIPRDFTPKLGSSLRSLGDEVIFVSSGALWRYLPGASRPERLYQPPADDQVIDIAGSNGNYAFVTQRSLGASEPLFRWRLWYLAAPGDAPTLVDQFDNDTLPAPTLAINERWIAWTPYHGAGNQAQNELRVASVADPGTSRTLVSYPALGTNMWNPALYGDELWYGIRQNDWDAGTEHPWIEMRNLADPAAAPQKYGEDLHAFMPAVNGEAVVWRSGPEDLSALNPGQPYVYWRDSGVEEPIADPHPALWDTAEVSYPSIGDRFVAWWDDWKSQFYVYDLQERTVRKIAEYDPYSRTAIAFPSVSGNLLTWEYFANDRTLPRVQWAYLPE
jgi:hypothetical protein